MSTKQYTVYPDPRKPKAVVVEKEDEDGNKEEEEETSAADNNYEDFEEPNW